MIKVLGVMYGKVITEDSPKSDLVLVIKQLEKELKRVREDG